MLVPWGRTPWLTKTRTRRTRIRDASNDGSLLAVSGKNQCAELVSTLEVFNMAKMQPNPFQWLQDYVEAMRVTLRSIKKPDVDDPAEGERLLVETRTSLEEFLERLVSRAGELKGAPGNPKK